MAKTSLNIFIFGCRFPEKIKFAMIFHAKLVCWRWREPPVAKWFFKNADELMNKLDNDPDTKVCRS